MSNKVTFYCVDCGKSRTSVLSYFRKPREEYRCASCAAKLRFKNPVNRENHRQGIENRSKNQKWRDQMALRNKNMAKDPKWREKHAEIMRVVTKTEKWKTNHKIGARRAAQTRLRDPEWRENNKKSLQRIQLTRSRNPTWNMRIKESANRRVQNPDYIESLMKEGFWYGNPSINNTGSRKKYCEKWNRNLWDRIDAAWDFKSAISGKTRWDNNNIRLSRHHVYWQKNACCIWDKESEKYYALINTGSKRYPVIQKYYITGDPNKFVLLTASEHTLVAGSRKSGKDILYWIKFFEDLIEQRRLDGKRCYLSREEYEEYKLKNWDMIKYYNRKYRPKQVLNSPTE